MKVASACVRALLTTAIAGHVIKLKLTRRGNTLASMERRPFPVYRRCGDDGS